MTSSAILIPARYNSTRFPGKPLALLDGVPMIKRVYDACIASKIPTYVLTDDQTIYNVIVGNCLLIERKIFFRKIVSEFLGFDFDSPRNKVDRQYR